MRTRYSHVLAPVIALVTLALLSTAVVRLGLPEATAADQKTDKTGKAKTAIKASAEESTNDSKEKSDGKEQKFETLTLRGKVRFLGPALEENFEVETVAESAERQIVLETTEGELVPIVEDIRGRAFRADDRLMGIDVELLVRRYKKSPFVQVIRLYQVKKDGLYVLDYWCDVCAIAMYELKPCDCCQAPNRLRERKVTPQGIADEVK